MSDFIKALEYGIKAATDAEANSSEISGVFSEISKQLESYTHGKLSLVKVTKNKIIDPLSLGISTVLTAPRKKVNYLCVKNNRTDREAENEPVQIVSFELAHTGYPVKLEFSDNTINAFDKSGLEHALKEVLAHPETGKAIKKILDNMID